MTAISHIAGAMTFPLGMADGVWWLVIGVNVNAAPSGKQRNGTMFRLSSTTAEAFETQDTGQDLMVVSIPPAPVLVANAQTAISFAFGDDEFTSRG
jgi:hypothetical protein